MKRPMIRLGMAGTLVALTFIVVMMWTAEYEADPDPAARFEVQAVKLKADRGYVWLEAHLRRSSDKPHDLTKPALLITANGTEHEPADNTFAGNPEQGFTDIWYKFWLEEDDLKGEIDLKINEGILKIKRSAPAPELNGEKETILKSSDWEKSWLGF
jgi:hypothetical protein